MILKRFVVFVYVSICDGLLIDDYIDQVFIRLVL